MLGQPVVRNKWMPTPSWGLAFLLVSIMLSMLIVGLFSWNTYFFAPVFKVGGAIALSVCTLLCLFRELWQMILLRSSVSVREIQRIGSKELLRWRVVLNNGCEHEFVEWCGSSCVMSWGMFLLYPVEDKSSSLWGRWMRKVKISRTRRIIILPSQLGREPYRQLCIQIIEGRFA